MLFRLKSSEMTSSTYDFHIVEINCITQCVQFWDKQHRKLERSILDFINGNIRVNTDKYYFHFRNVPNPQA